MHNVTDLHFAKNMYYGKKTTEFKLFSALYNKFTPQLIFVGVTSENKNKLDKSETELISTISVVHLTMIKRSH